MYMNQPRSGLTGLHNAPYPDNPIPRRAPIAFVPSLDLIFEFFAHQSSNDSYLSLGLVMSSLNCPHLFAANGVAFVTV